MSPFARAILQSWDLRLDVIAVLAFAMTIYVLGWLRLRKVGPADRPRSTTSSPWRLVSYCVGIVVVFVALLSPIDVLASHLFTLHMVQHLLLVMIAPPLMLLANPLPVSLWGLPRPVRKSSSLLLGRKATFRYLLELISSPGVTWMAFIIIFLGWHEPLAYDLALKSEFAHDIEHITFFVGGILFWWQVIPAGPWIRTRLGPLASVGYLLAAVGPNMLAGAAIAFSNSPIYVYYTRVPRTFGLSVMDDQRIGGLLMWIPGSMMLVMAALVIIGVEFQRASAKDQAGRPPAIAGSAATRSSGARE